MASLKHHVAIQPLIAILGGAVIFVGAFVSLISCMPLLLTMYGQVVRKCITDNDINWAKTKDLEVRFIGFRGRDEQSFEGRRVLWGAQEAGHQGARRHQDQAQLQGGVVLAANPSQEHNVDKCLPMSLMNVC